MMFEPGLTKGMLEVFVAPSHHLHCSADDQSTKAIDIQNAYLNGTHHPPEGRNLGFLFITKRVSAISKVQLSLIRGSNLGLHVRRQNYMVGSCQHLVKHLELSR